MYHEATTATFMLTTGLGTAWGVGSMHFRASEVLYCVQLVRDRISFAMPDLLMVSSASVPMFVDTLNDCCSHPPVHREPRPFKHSAWSLMVEQVNDAGAVSLPCPLPWQAACRPRHGVAHMNALVAQDCDGWHDALTTASELAHLRSKGSCTS